MFQICKDAVHSVFEKIMILIASMSDEEEGE